jgi:molybdopterin-guanine dinucleotide biosynthesis protein A
MRKKNKTRKHVPTLADAPEGFFGKLFGLLDGLACCMNVDCAARRKQR